MCGWTVPKDSRIDWIRANGKNSYSPSVDQFVFILFIFMLNIFFII